VAIDNSVGRDFTCFGFGASPAGRLLVGTVSASGDIPFTEEIGDLAGSLRAVREVQLADLDGDGDLDLLAVFAGEVRAADAGGDPAGSGVGVIWNQDGTLDPASLMSIDVGAQVFDADLIAVDDTGVPALLILAQGQVMLARLDAGTGTFGAAEFLQEQTGDGRLEVGDVNADGVTDFAFTVGADIHVILGIPQEPVGVVVVGTGSTEGGQ
jgi:hypothetical protein